ncbi:MAG: GntR family transcriptional regulator [Candidatus Dormiibacterota bacterium]
MPLAKVDLTGTHSRAEEIYRLLRDQILSGALKPNERLVESELAVMASISRTPVREAIRKLEVSGLVRNTGHGMVVGGISRDELTDVCAVRETLEGMAAGMAAAARTELGLLGLERVAAEYRAAAALEGSTPPVHLNDTFHERIWQMAGNHYLERQLGTLRSIIERSQATTLTVPMRRHQSADEHDRLVKLIAERKPDEARDLAQLHFREAMDIRLSMLETSKVEAV